MSQARDFFSYSLFDFKTLTIFQNTTLLKDFEIKTTELKTNKKNKHLKSNFNTKIVTLQSPQKTLKAIPILFDLSINIICLHNLNKSLSRVHT